MVSGLNLEGAWLVTVIWIAETLEQPILYSEIQEVYVGEDN